MAVKYKIIGFVFLILCSISNGQAPIVADEIGNAYLTADAATNTDAAAGGTSSTIKSDLRTFALAALAGTSANYITSKPEVGNKECKISYYYHESISLFPTMWAYYYDITGLIIDDWESLQGSGNSKDSSKTSLDGFTMLTKIAFMTGRNNKICLRSIEILCGAYTGLGNSVRRTQIPLVNLKPELKARNYTPEDQDDAKYENDNMCVYIYGKSTESSKRFFGFEVKADIFECGTKSKDEDKLKCVIDSVILYDKPW